MLKTNGNYQKTALETVKYEVHGGGFWSPHPLNHQRYENLKPAEGWPKIRRFKHQFVGAFTSLHLLHVMKLYYAMIVEQRYSCALMCLPVLLREKCTNWVLIDKVFTNNILVLFKFLICIFCASLFALWVTSA